MTAPIESVSFVVLGPPVPKGRPRFVRGRAVTPARTREYEKLVRDVAALHCGHWRRDGLYRVTIELFSPTCLRGDTDNYAKALLDAIEGHAFDNDRQVVELVVRKNDRASVAPAFAKVLVERVWWERGQGSAAHEAQKGGEVMGEPAQRLIAVVDVARECDAAFIYSSWMHSYRESPLTSRWTDSEYQERMGQRIGSLLERSRVLVARPPDWDEGIIGWAAAEQRSGKFLLHYAFVRGDASGGVPLFRHRGVLSLLIQQHEPKGRRLITTLRPPFTNYIKRLGFRFEQRR
jgi:crossover junction endodeoxyribonuclease RusA